MQYSSCSCRAAEYLWGTPTCSSHSGTALYETWIASQRGIWMCNSAQTSTHCLFLKFMIRSISFITVNSKIQKSKIPSLSFPQLLIFTPKNLNFKKLQHFISQLNSQADLILDSSSNSPAQACVQPGYHCSYQDQALPHDLHPTLLHWIVPGEGVN